MECCLDLPSAEVAQLVEQRTENPRVSSSILLLGIFYCQIESRADLTGQIIRVDAANRHESSCC